MKLAVVGSRDFPEGLGWRVRGEIQSVALRVGWDNLTVVSGGARGVDAMAERYAADFRIPCEVYRADWKRYGRAAGIRRNELVVSAADEMLAFFGPTRTPGTSDAIRKAHFKGIPVYVFESLP